MYLLELQSRWPTSTYLQISSLAAELSNVSSLFSYSVTICRTSTSPMMSADSPEQPGCASLLGLGISLLEQEKRSEGKAIGQVREPPV